MLMPAKYGSLYCQYRLWAWLFMDSLAHFGLFDWNDTAMKALLRTLFSPILNVFEKSEEAYLYKPSHRKILIAMGVLFGILTSALIAIIVNSESNGALIPALVFGSVCLVTLVVGFLGTEKAVANIWNSRN